MAAHLSLRQREAPLAIGAISAGHPLRLRHALIDFDFDLRQLMTQVSLDARCEFVCVVGNVADPGGATAQRVAVAMAEPMGWDEQQARSAARAFLDEAASEGIVTGP